MRRYLNRNRVFDICAYLLLAAAIAYAINLSDKNASSANNQLAAKTAAVLYQSCQSGNNIRRSLRQIIQAQLPATRAAFAFYVKQHVVSQTVADTELATTERQIASELKALTDRNCGTPGQFAHRLKSTP